MLGEGFADVQARRERLDVLDLHFLDDGYEVPIYHLADGQEGAMSQRAVGPDAGPIIGN